MKALFLATKQPSSAIEKWAAALQGTTSNVKHVVAWSGPECLATRYHGNTCNLDSFLVTAGESLESHVARTFSGSSTDYQQQSLVLVSLESAVDPRLLPKAGVVLLIWQPQVPADLVQACQPLPTALAIPDAASRIRGLLLVDPSPSLTVSVTHKALEGAGMQALSRKPVVLAPRSGQAPQATLQALLQLSDGLPHILAPQPALPPGASVRIAVARDDAFCPPFHENLALLHLAGAQLLPFSPLYDATLPVGAACLYLSSGPLEAERWQQLAANRPLLAVVRAFCEAGGLVLAEGAGLPYLSRHVLVNEDDGASHRLYEMAGVLPFKAELQPQPAAARVHVTVTPGNPLLPAGARARGYMSGMASILLQEERQLLGLGAGGGAPSGKTPSPQFTTTFEADVARPEGDKQQGQPVVLPEGYTVNNVLASSCLLYLPSEPGLVGHLVRRVACVDTGALAAGMAQQLGLTMGSGLALGLGVPAKLQAALASAAGSRAGSRRQSIQDVCTWGAGAHGGNGVLMQQPPGSPRGVQQQGGGSNGVGSYYGYGAVQGGSHNGSTCLPPGATVRRSLNTGGAVAADSVVSLGGQQPDAAHHHAPSHLAMHQPYPSQQQPYSSGPSPPGSYPGYGPPDASVALRSRPPSRNSLRPSADFPPPLAPARSPSPGPEPHAASTAMPASQLLTFQPQPHTKPHAPSNLSRSGSACSISPASAASQPVSAPSPSTTPAAASAGFLTAALGPHQPLAIHTDPTGQPGDDDSLGLETTASLATWAAPGSGMSAETLAHLLERRESQRQSSSSSNRRSSVLSSSHGQGLLGGSGSGSVGAQDDVLGRPKSCLHHAASTGSMPWPAAGPEQQQQQGVSVDHGAGEALQTVFAPPLGPPTVGAALAGPWDGPPQGLGLCPAAGVPAGAFPWINGARHSRRYSHDALMGLVAGNGNASVPGQQQLQQQQLPDQQHLAANGYHAAHQHPFTPQRQHPFYSHGHHNSATGMAQAADFARSEAGAGMAWGWPGPNAAALQYSVPTFSAMAAAAAAAGAGGVVCCSPGACEALVAMGLGNRLGGVSNDCDYPPDVCTSRRVVLGWAAPEEGQRRGMVRGGIRALAPSASAQAVGAAAVAGFLSVVGRLGGGKASAGGAAGRQSGDRERGGMGVGGGPGAEDAGTEGGGAGGRVLLLDELALRQEPPSLLVLPDVAELSMGERAQLEQALVQCGLVTLHGGGTPGGSCMVLHAACRSLVDVMDLILELGAAAGDTAAACMLLERLQARMRRVAAAAALAAVPAAGVAAPLGPRKPPRVLVLRALQPMIEPGRWVPEMLSMVGAASVRSLPGGPDVALSWQDLRDRAAAPDVLIILTPAAADGPAAQAQAQAAASTTSLANKGDSGQAAGPVSLAQVYEQLASMAAQPGWWCVPAVRRSQVYLVHSPLVLRPGPRLVDGCELLARLLLPGYASSRRVPPGAVMRLSLAAGQRCRASLLPSYFVPMVFN